MTFELLKLGLILFPGVIVISILQIFNVKSETYTNTKFFLYSFINGIIIEFLYFLFFLKSKFKIEFNPENDNIIEIKDFMISIDYKDIFFLILISILTGIVLSFLRNNGYIHNIFYKFNITYETGFETLFYSIYHSKDKEFSEASQLDVCIRFLDGKAIYYGELVGYDIQKEYIEIFLKDVKVYLKNKNELSDVIEENSGSFNKFYKREFIYLQLKSCEFQIEYINKEGELGREIM